MDAVQLSVFSSRLQAICDEMGAVLQRTAFSTNIRDRLDYSCAVFDAQGRLASQAAHIPVHLGSMCFAMTGIVSARDWVADEMIVLNDPFLGGTHLPDVSVIAPLHVGGSLIGFVVNRAHHADIGADQPGSMPISRSLDEEGVVIPPTRLVQNGEVDHAFLDSLAAQMRSGGETRADLTAQISANTLGLSRLRELVGQHGEAGFNQGLAELNGYARRLAVGVIGEIRDGEYRFTDYLDDDGLPASRGGQSEIPIQLCLRVDGESVTADFSGTAEQVGGNVNCPLSVAAAAVYYVFRCLMPAQTPACAGAFEPIRIVAPEGSLVNARRPAAVAAGNVETSTRIVDVVMGALATVLPERIPAASHGSMNNLAMGSAAPDCPWDYYETIGGGMGAGPRFRGLSGVQTHMTNTLNTPIEVLEQRFPVRVERYAYWHGSGGDGRHRGGDGLLREYLFAAPASVTLLTERRRLAPWGLAGGEPGAKGENRLNGERLGAKQAFTVSVGDRLSIATPGGGGWGRTESGAVFESVVQDAEQRPAAVLSAVSGLSVAEVKRVMQKGAVWLERGHGKRRHTRRLRRASSALQPGDRLFLYHNPAVLDERPLKAERVADQGDYSVWKKPAGMLSQGSKWGDHTALVRLVESADERQRPAFLVHRLDKAAAGLMLIAHSKSASRELSALFAERDIDKRYRVRVRGTRDLWLSQTGDAAAPWRIETPLDGKDAITEARLIDASVDAALGDVLDLEVRIITGRKHQIRRHLSEVGLPVLGDRLYAQDKATDLQLCCVKLRVPDTQHCAGGEFQWPDFCWSEHSET